MLTVILHLYTAGRKSIDSESFDHYSGQRTFKQVALL